MSNPHKGRTGFDRLVRATGSSGSQKGSSSWAGAINVFARLSNAEGGEEGLTGFVVRQGAPGLRFGPQG